MLGRSTSVSLPSCASCASLSRGACVSTMPFVVGGMESPGCDGGYDGMG